MMFKWLSDIQSSIFDQMTAVFPVAAPAQRQSQEPEVSAQPAPQPDPVPKVPAQPAFVIIRTIGLTSRAVVYEALHNNKRIALKKDIKYDISVEAHYLNEAAHPNVVQYHGIIMDQGIKMMSMEYMDQGDLCDYLDANATPGASNNPERVSLMRDFLKGLAYLQTINLIHRDIKCENIFLRLKDGQLRAKIGDFGFARIIDPDKKFYQADRFRGTPGYVAPEVFKIHWLRVVPVRGAVKNVATHVWTQKSDVYGAGVVLLMMACDDKPYVYDQITVPKLTMDLNRSGKIPEIHPEVYKPVRDLILWCFKPLGERPSAAQLLEKYEAIHPEDPVNTTTTSTTQPFI